MALARIVCANFEPVDAAALVRPQAVFRPGVLSVWSDLVRAHLAGDQVFGGAHRSPRARQLRADRGSTAVYTAVE